MRHVSIRTRRDGDARPRRSPPILDDETSVTEWVENVAESRKSGGSPMATSAIIGKTKDVCDEGVLSDEGYSGSRTV